MLKLHNQSSCKFHFQCLILTKCLLYRVQGIDAGDEAAAWISKVLERDCRLVQMNPNHYREAKKNKGRTIIIIYLYFLM